MRKTLLADIPAGTCLLATSSTAAPADSVRGNPVNVKWLEKNLAHADVVVLNASPAAIFAKNYIPGAVSVDVYSWRNSVTEREAVHCEGPTVQ